jgi:molybdopterin converting factor small subunit
LDEDTQQSIDGEINIKVKVYIPAFINHELMDTQSCVTLDAHATLADLFHQLEIPLPLRLSFLYMVNYQQANWNTPLDDGDVVSFIFPISGG